MPARLRYILNALMDRADGLGHKLRRALGLKEKTLGTARTGRDRYDLPLAGGTGSGFLILLVALMTFLATMALSASLALQGLGTQWRSGLEGKATVEIPATDEDGKVRPEPLRRESRTKILTFLKGAPAVAKADLLAPADLASLVEPWLGAPGDNGGLQGIALPDLISVTLADQTPETLQALDEKIRAIDSRARLDRHQDWLADMLRLARALQTAAMVLVLVTGLTTAASVGGAVRSRMAEHKADIEILHLMGAMDSYVVRQFQRHTAGLALRGGLIGLLGAGVVLWGLKALAGTGDNAGTPAFSLSTFQTLVLVCLPGLAACVAGLSARMTVSRALARMP